MSKPDYWLENACASNAQAPLPHFLLDVGYANAKLSRDRADRVLAVLALAGKRSCQVAGAGRILIRIPPKKLAAVLDACPEIQEGSGYCWTTHHWLSAETTDLKYAMK